MIELKFAELHSPIFLAGTNLGMKLNPDQRAGLKVHYSRDQKELVLEYKGETAIVPTTNVVSMTPKLAGTRVVQPIPKAPDPEMARPTAQVETPQSHVFAGPGKGQTGQEKPKTKVVL